MRTQAKMRLAGIVVFLFVLNNTFSQVTGIEKLQASLPNISYSKTQIKVLDEFQKLFSNAENVRWTNLGKDFLVTFTVRDLRYRVLLNPKGKLLYKITYGKEKLLPADIRKMVKRAYVEFLITAASYVEEANRKIWVINIEDDLKYVIVRVEENELHENLSFTKYQ